MAGRLMLANPVPQPGQQRPQPGKAGLNPAKEAGKQGDVRRQKQSSCREKKPSLEDRQYQAR